MATKRQWRLRAEKIIQDTVTNAKFEDNLWYRLSFCNKLGLIHGHQVRTKFSKATARELLTANGYLCESLPEYEPRVIWLAKINDHNHVIVSIFCADDGVVCIHFFSSASLKTQESTTADALLSIAL